jgi:hypothetical protein
MAASGRTRARCELRRRWHATYGGADGGSVARYGRPHTSKGLKTSARSRPREVVNSNSTDRRHRAHAYLLGLSRASDHAFAALMDSSSLAPYWRHAERLMAYNNRDVRCGRRIESCPSKDSIHRWRSRVAIRRRLRPSAHALSAACRQTAESLFCTYVCRRTVDSLTSKFRVKYRKPDGRCAIQDSQLVPRQLQSSRYFAGLHSAFHRAPASVRSSKRYEVSFYYSAAPIEPEKLIFLSIIKRAPCHLPTRPWGRVQAEGHP